MRLVLLCILFVPLLVCPQSSPSGKNNSLPGGSGQPPNDPPVWNNTPTPVFSFGIAASYSLVPGDVSDPEEDTLTITNETGCTLSGTGLSIDDANDEIDYDGVGAAADLTGCMFGADDSTNPRVDSSAFTISINSIPAAGTIYERDLLGNPRVGAIGANEPDASPPTFPVAELNDVLAFDYSLARYNCDSTITTGAGNWNDVNNGPTDVACVNGGSHTSKAVMVLTDEGSIDAVDLISAITLSNPVKVDFTAAHGWVEDDLIWCNRAVGGTWQLQRRWFIVSIVDTDTVDLNDQDGTGTGLRPAWKAFTSGGGCQRVNPKVVRITADITANPVSLAEGSKAKVRQIELGSPGEGNTLKYILLMGLTCSHDGLSGTIGATCIKHFGADWVVYDRMEFQNEDALTDITADNIQDIMRVSGGSDIEDEIHNVQMQRSVCHEPGVGDEQSWFQLTDNSSGIRLTDNEAQDCRMGVVLNEGAHDGFLISETSIYSTLDYHSDCSGNVEETDMDNFAAGSTASCKGFEGPFAFKGAHSTGRLVNVNTVNRGDLIVIDAVVHAAERTEDIVLGQPADGTSGNISLGFSDNSKDKNSVLFRNNVEIDTGGQGIPTGPSSCNTSAGIDNNFNTVLGNLNYIIGGIAWSHFVCSGDNFDSHEYQHNSIVNASEWLHRASVQQTTWECNLIIDGGGRTFGLSTGSVQKENFGYGDTTDMDGSGDFHGGATSNANMNDWVINPMKHTNPSFQYTLIDVLTTSTSPHRAGQANDCPSIGTSGRGTTDATVTY